MAAEIPLDGDKTGVLPALYWETMVHADRKRAVQLGPFTHNIDDGLPLRKAAFSCLDS